MGIAQLDQAKNNLLSLLKGVSKEKKGRIIGEIIMGSDRKLSRSRQAMMTRTDCPLVSVAFDKSPSEPNGNESPPKSGIECTISISPEEARCLAESTSSDQGECEFCIALKEKIRFGVDVLLG